MNSRISRKDKGRIKGALRRAFTGSDLHKTVIARITVDHSDPRHPRCEYWGYCEICGVVQPRWRIEVDHVEPVVPVDSSLHDMTVTEVVDRLWCDEKNLAGICTRCHNLKTAVQAEIRTRNKKAKKGKK